MATYKVPQDVEADDKLIGPFSFRQFIYLIIVAMAGFAAWGLAQLFIGLVIIPLPIIIFFAALALPLKKDQPMEIYLAAIVSFYIKPRKRLWDPEGIDTLIEITAPKTYEENRTNGLSQNEAEQRFSYLANIVDSGGWAIRGNGTTPSMSMNNDIYLEAQSAVDVLDTNNSVGQSFNQLIAQTTVRAREDAVERMQAATFQPTIVAPAPTPPVVDSATIDDLVLPEYNPYPTNIQQTVIQPLNDPSHMAEQDIRPVAVTPPKPVHATPSKAAIVPAKPSKPIQNSTTTSDTPVSADIINLANNIDGLSIATVQHEANRIHKKLEEESQEVVISLR